LYRLLLLATQRSLFLLFLLFLQEIISERLRFAAEILDRQHHSGKKNSKKTAGAVLRMPGRENCEEK